MTEGRDAAVEGQGPEPDSPGVHGQSATRAPGKVAPDYETSHAWVALLLAGAVALAWFGGWSLLLVVLGIVAMITIHELGHYLTAKWAGMKVTEFFIGFGPRLWSFRRGDTEYGIKPFPVGAYVRIVGMSNLDEVDPADEPRTYRQQSFPKRLIVVLAGPATHFVQALIIVFMLLAVAGMPGGTVSDLESQWMVAEVTEDSAAEEAGLEPGDRVVRFDGEPVGSWAELTSLIRSTEVGDEISMQVVRGGDVFETSAAIGGRPRAHARDGVAAGTPFLGLGWDVAPTERLGIAEAFVETPGQTVGVGWDAISALGSFFSPSGLDSFADSVSEGADDQADTTPSATAPSGGEGSDDDSNRLLSIYGAVRLGAALGEQSWAGLLMFFLSINIFVGLINLVPLLPFDGGHVAVAVYERIRSRSGRRYHADVTKMLPVAYVVLMGLVLLGITTLYLDIVDPVQL